MLGGEGAVGIGAARAGSCRNGAAVGGQLAPKFFAETTRQALFGESGGLSVPRKILRASPRLRHLVTTGVTSPKKGNSWRGLAAPYDPRYWCTQLTFAQRLLSRRHANVHSPTTHYPLPTTIYQLIPKH